VIFLREEDTMNILIHGPLISSRLGRLKNLIDFPCSLKHYNCPFSSEEFLVDLRNSHVLITMEFPNINALKNFPNKLNLIQIPGGGIDKINFSLIPPHVSVCTAPHHDEAIAEYVLLGILSFLKNLKEIETSFRKNSWELGLRCGGPLTRQIKNKKIGVVGYGKIGKSVAKKLRPLEAIIYACNRSSIEDEAVDKFFNLDEINDMIPEVDFLVISIALAPETKNIINESTFTLMKSHAVIINVSRGGCVEEESLFNACKNRKIGGAVIDVWYSYPELGEKVLSPSHYPFSQLGNVIMTPHISSWTEESLDEKLEVIAHNINALSKNEPLLNRIER
jgi:phosphoglycerate dehydrogenase-like enzyme